MIFASVVVPLAFLVWLTVARLRWLSAAVAAALALLAAGTVGLAAVQPRARVESLVLLFVGVAAILLIGREVQRRRLGEDRPRWRWPYRMGVGLALLVGCSCFPALAWDFNDETFAPSAAYLDPLPDGVTLVERSRDSADCGGTCLVSYTIHGRPGEPAEEAADRLWRRITGSDDWRVDYDGWYCRPAGLLLDTTSVCARVGTDSGTPEVTLFGHPTYRR